MVPEELTHRSCYELEPIVAVPAKHELAKEKRISLQAVGRFPILNAPDGFPSEPINAALRRAGAFSHPDRHSELHFTQTILRYVQLGLGIGIVVHPVGFKLQQLKGVVENSLAEQFDNLTVHAVNRIKTVPDPVETGFIDIRKEHYC